MPIGSVLISLTTTFNNVSSVHTRCHGLANPHTYVGKLNPGSHTSGEGTAVVLGCVTVHSIVQSQLSVY